MDDTSNTNPATFEDLVERYYCGLYQFALSLTCAEAEACDLTQQTFYVWAKKGHQLRESGKVKTWLFTTLHREFLSSRRHQQRFPHVDLDAAEAEIPGIAANVVNELDAKAVFESLQQVAEPYRAPLSLFYVEDLAYKDIAGVLGLPVGTVQSRIARGKAQLMELLQTREAHHE